MLHPLFSTLIQRPDLLIDHLSAYVSLFGQEAKGAGTELVQKILAGVLAIVCGSIFLVLTGIALMLGFMQNQFHLILVVVPLLMLLVTALAVFRAKKPLPTEHFPLFKEQLHTDVVALRMAS